MNKFILTVNFAILYFILIIGLVSHIEDEKGVEDCKKEIQIMEEIKSEDINQIEDKKVIEIKEEHNPEYVFNDLGWKENDDYLLAKIAMAEAENCSLETKMYIIATVLNRVQNNAFPNTIAEVIYQKRGNVYQFSPIGDGRWDKVEPNEECWLALEKVKESQYNFSLGALYFESCANEDNWHSKNLNFLFKSDTMRFYN